MDDKHNILKLILKKALIDNESILSEIEMKNSLILECKKQIYLTLEIFGFENKLFLVEDEIDDMSSDIADKLIGILKKIII